MTQSNFDPGRYEWREVTGEARLSYKVHHDYTILGYDLAAGTLDMVVRWAADGGHCPIHRHVATTTVLVLDGEQHLWDLHPDGTRGEHKVRRAGDYALTVGDTLPHLERGGSAGRGRVLRESFQQWAPLRDPRRGPERLRGCHDGSTDRRLEGEHMSLRRAHGRRGSDTGGSVGLMVHGYRRIARGD